MFRAGVELLEVDVGVLDDDGEPVMKAERYEQLCRDRVPMPEHGVCYSMATEEMGLAPGGLMRQELYEDEYGFDSWEHGVRSRCFVHLLNSAQYRAVTDAAPPHEPPTAAEYTEAGLPWFEYYDADRRALEGAPRLARLDSLTARQVKEENGPPAGRKTTAPKPGQVKRIGPAAHRVRDGGTSW